MKSKLLSDLQTPSDGFFSPDGPDAFPKFLALPPIGPASFSTTQPPVAVLAPTIPDEAVEAQAAQNGSGGPGSVVAETAGNGITINLEFDAAAMAAPASFRAGIEQAASILSSTITNKITVNLQIDYSGTGGGAAAGPDNGQFVSFSTVRADLIHNAAPGDITFNALPTGSSIQGQSSVAVWNAQLKLFGLLGANDTTTDDGSATFATDISSSLLVGVALHELTHALGRVPYGTQPDIFDFYRFTSAGTRLFTDSIPAAAAYFSVDGGNTKLADYGLYSDPSDFLNPGPTELGGPYSNLTPNDAFNELYGSSTLQMLTAVDLKQLDALGFNTVDIAPVLTVPSANVAATAGEVIAASSLFSATDAEGNPLTYYILDNSPAADGHFVVNGTVEPNGTVFTVTAAQLAETSFVAGAGGTTSNLYVIAYDGQQLSGPNYTEFHVNVAPSAAPVLTVPSTNVAATSGESIAASNLFSATGGDGNPLTYYILDNSPVADGHFVDNGVTEPNGSVFSVSAAQLAETSFVAGAAGTSSNLYVIAYDGQNLSGPDYTEFHVNVAAAQSPQAPVLTVPSTNVTATSAGESIAASSLFSATDSQNFPLTYYVLDNSTNANSGHFAVNGTAEPNGTVFSITEAQLAETTFVAGTGTTDNLYVIAYDGQNLSGPDYTAFHVTAPSLQPPVLTVPSANVAATPGQSLAASSLFSATDPQNFPLTYYLLDNTITANTGHFAVNGVAEPNGSVFSVTAAQLAHTTFVAGNAGTSADLFVIAYDGHALSGTQYTEFHILV
jgi:hypothetical protein